MGEMEKTKKEQMLEDRVEKMHEKADEKATEFNVKAEGETDADKRKQLEDKAQRVQDRADKREDRMRKSYERNQSFKEATKEEWGNFLDGLFGVNPYEKKKIVATESIDAPAPNNESVIKETIIPTPNGTTEVAEVATNRPKVLSPEEQASKDRLAAYTRYNTAVSDGLSAYQELVKKSMEKKQEIAQRRERNARSVALANALGALTNAITAGAMAKKHGTIPIVSQFDKEPDTNLRKSIEGRYALENENENLLLKLAQERRAHEAELANNTLKSELADISAREKAEIYERRRKQELADWEKKEAIRHANDVELTGIKGEQKATQAAQKAQQKAAQAAVKAEEKAKKEAGKPYTVKNKDAQNQFVNATTIKETTKNNALGQEIKETKQDKALVPYMKKAYAYFEQNNFSGDELTKAASVLREVAKGNGEALKDDIGYGIIEAIKDLIKNDKQVLSADQIVVIVNKAIEHSKQEE